MSDNNVAATRTKKQRRINAVSPRVEALFNIILGLFCAFCIIPFVFVIIISFTSENSINTVGYTFFPAEWSLGGYKFAFDMGTILWKSYFNSFYITILGTILSLLMTGMYSYALFRKDYKYRGFFTFFCFFTMIFGGGLQPTYIVCKQILGLSNNYAALIVPMLLNPFNVIIMRTFFQSSVPEELIEAATIDGSGEYNTLFRIVVPVAKPGIATVGLLTALGYWNEWFLALLYITDNDHMPLQYLLMRMQRNVEFLMKNISMVGPSVNTNLPTNSIRMVFVVLIVVPISCAYPFFQRYIISGLTIGSVKG